MDLAVAVLLVLLLVVSGALGAALAAVASIALLAARALWLFAAAVWRRTGRGDRTAARRRGPSPAARAMRTSTMAALITLVIASISYGESLSAPSNSSVAIRTVEWMRDNGAGSLVSSVETFFYSLTAPSKGGPGLTQLPSAPGVSGSASAAAHAYPPAVSPVIGPRLPGEGMWHPTQRFTAGAPPVLVTTYRPDPSYPRVVAGLAWIDPQRAKLGLYPGLKEPGGSGPRGSAQVPAADRAGLLAVFNSGFKHVDSHGGFFASGHLFQPLVQGQGTIVGTSDGRVDVRAWTGGASPGPGVSFVRQNLPLIVSDGAPNPTLGDSSKWGTTVGNSVLVWRSGLGVDRAGHVIYAAANYQSARGLARILVHAGAVRAVELDINSYWVSFNAFGKQGGQNPKKLLPDMNRSSARYLSPDDRDFFAVTSLPR
jgi:hypothetical protein